MKVFLNGSIVTEENAVISVFDHGFLYGFGLFETLRAYNGSLFLFAEHYERLKASARQYGIEMNKTIEEVRGHVEDTMEANNLDDAYIRITLAGGQEALGLHGEEHQNPSWVIMAKPIGKPPASKSLFLLHTKRTSPEGLSSG